MIGCLVIWGRLVVGLYLLSLWGFAQVPGEQPGASKPSYARSVESITKALLRDQKRIWTSPVRLRPHDLVWLAPLAGTTAYLLASDERNMTERLRSNPQARDRAALASNVSLGALAGVPAYLYWYGWRHSDEYAQETALLSARAAAGGLIVAQAIHLLTWRERPEGASGAGRFYRSSSLSSGFPSMHVTAAWAMAPILAERYPGWLTKLAVYGLAGAATFSRLPARAHFPSDVFVGSALGWLIGQSMAHPDRAARLHRFALAAATDESQPGSVYVPIDSWTYSALDRLAALGLIPTQISGIRPWTRTEFQRQLREADDRLSIEAGGINTTIAKVAGPFLTALHREFDEATPGKPMVVLDSVYFRNGVIAGPALTDSFHFGQTWRNDSGRPFGRGWNSIEGFTARAESGRFFAFVQGEYQHAPEQNPYSLETRELIAGLDANPVQPAQPSKPTDRFRTVEAYAGVRVSDLEFSVGKEALYWGTTNDAPLSFSNNAEPTKNGKISTIHPIHLPGFLHYLGAIRGEFVIGKLGGQQYTWRPWFNAQKLSFKLSENLELGFTRWSILWGVGHPITVGSFIQNLTSVISPSGPSRVGRTDPGDRKAGFDFRYRIPGLRNWLTLYSDTYSDDDPSPLAAPRRAAFSPGLYLAHVPGIPHLDLRMEAASTTPYQGDQGGTFIYYNNQYHSGNTNYGTLQGNPVGRDGRAIEGWARYWFSPRSKVEAGYRQTKVGSLFLPGGGTQSDAMLKSSLQVANNCFAEVAFQYERYWIPVLSGPKRNLSGSFQLRWEPKLPLLH